MENKDTNHFEKKSSLSKNFTVRNIQIDFIFLR